MLASADPDMLAAGSDASRLEDRFLISGQDFFDYGASEIRAGFISLVPKTRMEELVRPLMLQERRQRTLMALTLSLLFIGTLVYLMWASVSNWRARSCMREPASASPSFRRTAPMVSIF